LKGLERRMGAFFQACPHESEGRKNREKPWSGRAQLYIIVIFVSSLRFLREKRFKSQMNVDIIE